MYSSEDLESFFIRLRVRPIRVARAFKMFCHRNNVSYNLFEISKGHFMEDGHYNYFDDMYSPEHVCQGIMEAVISSIKCGYFPKEELKWLEEGLEKLRYTMAHENCGTRMRWTHGESLSFNHRHECWQIININRILILF